MDFLLIFFEQAGIFDKDVHYPHCSSFLLWMTSTRRQTQQMFWVNSRDYNGAIGKYIIYFISWWYHKFQDDG